MSAEDERQAASLVVNLSGGLTAGSVAVIGAAAAVTTFVADKYEVGWPFYSTMFLSIVLLAWGITCGGKAVDAICRRGANGDWANAPSERAFNFQAMGAALGTVILLVAVAIGLQSDRRASEDAQSKALQTRMQRLEDQVVTITTELRRSQTEQSDARLQIEQLKARVARRDGA